jgi:hypothetical protein
MKRVYVAGPFRAATPWAIEQHIRTAETIALAAWRAGAATYCPHTCTRFFQHSAPDDVWLQGHLQWLNVADVVLLVPQWRRSEGTCIEVAAARQLNMPVFEAAHVSDEPALLERAYALGIDGRQLDLARNFIDWLNA